MSDLYLLGFEDEVARYAQVASGDKDPHDDRLGTLHLFFPRGNSSATKRRSGRATSSTSTRP